MLILSKPNMYVFGDFAKLIIVLLVAVIVYLIFKRLQNKKKEDFEDRDN